MERQPDWDYWNAFESLEVWQAVALSVGRDPATVTDNRKRLVRSDQELDLFDAGPEFKRRLMILESAFDVDSSRFTLPNDYYSGFKLFEERKVLPAKIAAYFNSKNMFLPPEWKPVTSIESDGPQTAPPGPPKAPTEESWRQRAQVLFREMAAGSPLSKPQLAEKVAERLHREGTTGRGGKRLTGTTVLRHALQNIPKP